MQLLIFPLPACFHLCFSASGTCLMASFLAIRYLISHATSDWPKGAHHHIAKSRLTNRTPFQSISLRERFHLPSLRQILQRLALWFWLLQRHHDGVACKEHDLTSVEQFQSQSLVLERMPKWYAWYYYVNPFFRRHGAVTAGRRGAASRVARRPRCQCERCFSSCFLAITIIS